MTRAGEESAPSANRPGGGASGRLRWVPLLLLAVLVAVFVLLCATGMRRESATWDEVPNFALGRYLLAHGRWDVPGSVSHPPLSYYLQSLPILGADLPMDVFRYPDEKPNRFPAARGRDLSFLGSADFRRGQKLLAAPGYGEGALLNRARFSMVALGAAALLLVFWYARSLYGPWGGLVAAALFGFSPNILAHFRLLTPDPVLTAAVLLSAFTMARAFARPSAGRVLFAGVALGLALLSKHTALVLPGAYGAIGFIEAARAALGPGGGRAGARLLARRAALVAAALAVALAVVALAYQGNIGAYVQSVSYQLAHGSMGHRGYLMGEYSVHGWWYYFVVVMLVKTPLPTLLVFAAALAGALTAALRRRPNDPDLVAELFLVVPGALIFLMFSVKQLAMGLRYILPMFPLLMVLSGRLARAARPRGLKVAAVLLAAWLVAGTLRVYPHFLAFFNEAAGGPGNGYKVLSDSNLDWGQELIELRDFMRERNIDRVALSYFGTDDPSVYGIRYTWLPSYFLNRPPGPPEIEFPPRGWVAVSATCLVGIPFPEPNPFAYFLERTPDAVLGHSMFVYHVEE